jgi:heptosyltransferase III
LNIKPKSILISRTDSIGDVVHTLPMAKVLKDNFPEVKITFLATEYTRPIIEACKFIDNFFDVSEFLNKKRHERIKWDTIIHVFPRKEIAIKAKELGIPLRIGTSGRIFHLRTCNKLIGLSRKNSDLHEAQLNLKLLEAFNFKTDFTLSDIQQFFGLVNIESLQDIYKNYIKRDKYNLIIHPKSKGNAREWSLNNFIQLINSLDSKRFNILISGTKEERKLLNEIFKQVGNKVTDITRLMNLPQFISFINKCDGFIGNSTGPLHLAAVLGKDALGIYPPIRPMHPGRWAPIGKKAKFFAVDKKCNDCRKKPKECHCINEIKPEEIKRAINNLSNSSN